MMIKSKALRDKVSFSKNLTTLETNLTSESKSNVTLKLKVYDCNFEKI